MARLSIVLFGPPKVTLDGEEVSFESDKVRALLAYLALEGKSPHRREKLAGLLWPDRTEGAARNNLRHGLAVLRRAIDDREANPPLLQVTRQTIQFNAASDAWIDVAAFTSLLQAEEPAAVQTIRKLKQAVELYRGDLLEGFSLPDCPAFEEWALLTREQFRRLVTDALYHLAALYGERGEYDSALRHARRQIELDPWREEAHAQVMRLLAQSGRRSEALAQYETCRQLLAEELGVGPAEATTALCEQIKAGEIAPPDHRAAVPPHNLPASLVPFVGRDAELAEIRDCLRDPVCRLLTLVGPGGSGKTRLAVEAATGLISEAPVDPFCHGLYFVSLAPLQSASLIVPAIAQVLSFPFPSAAESGPEVGPKRQLLDHLRRKKMLLIMDGFEHLLEGAEIVTDILRTAPDVKILVTSRSRLNVRGEFLYAVPGMEVPHQLPDSPLDLQRFAAVKLFLESARRIRPGFKPTIDDLVAVARICRVVGGLPLAVLLAAAWMDVLSPTEIADEISGDIERSLDFLETDWCDVPERQRSLRAVFDHSWNLLSERQRALMQALSAFLGGFTRPAAEQVAGASLHELRILVDKSFLQRAVAPPARSVPNPRPADAPGSPGLFQDRPGTAGPGWREGRYEVHELFRQYAAERLRRGNTFDHPDAVTNAVHDRHCAYYAAALQRWETELKGPRQLTALTEMEADSENIRAAWSWAVAQGQVERLQQSAEGLAWFYWWSGRYQEGEAAFQAAAEMLAAAGPSPAASGDQGPAAQRLRFLVHALSWQSYFSRASGRRELADQLQQVGMALLEQPELAGQDMRRERALLLVHMGHTVLMSDYGRATQLFEQSLALYRELADEWRTAWALNFLGDVSFLRGAYDQARQLFAESLTISHALGDEAGTVWSMAALAHVLMCQGQFEEAERLARKSSIRSLELGDRELIAYGLLTRGHTLQSLGRLVEARSALAECLAIFEDLGRRGWATSAHAELASVNLHLGRYERARARAETGLALARETGLRFRIGHTLLLLGAVALAEGAHTRAQRLLEESIAVYKETGKPDDLACAHAVSACAECGLGQQLKAQWHLSRVLQIASEAQYALAMVYGLPALARLLADQGKGEQAVELYEVALRHPLVANSRWFVEVAGTQVGAAGATLPARVLDAARGRGQTRDLQTIVSEWLVELNS